MISTQRLKTISTQRLRTISTQRLKTISTQQLRTISTQQSKTISTQQSKTISTLRSDNIYPTIKSNIYPKVRQNLPNYQRQYHPIGHLRKFLPNNKTFFTCLTKSIIYNLFNLATWSTPGCSSRAWCSRCSTSSPHSSHTCRHTSRRLLLYTLKIK